MSYNSGDRTRLSTPTHGFYGFFLFFLSPLHVLLYLSPSPCHVLRYDYSFPLSSLSVSPLSAYIGHLFGPFVQTLHPLFFYLPLLLFLLIRRRVILTSPHFLRFGFQMKDLSLCM